MRTTVVYSLGLLLLAPTNLALCSLTAGDACTFEITARCLAALTGSRSAVAAGRIPVETVACDIAHDWQASRVNIGSCTIKFASWVDNYYAFGSDLPAAIRIAGSFEPELLTRWTLEIKASSRSVLNACSGDVQHDDDKWPRASCVNVLGHLISDDASPWPCWKRLKDRCGQRTGKTVLGNRRVA